MEWRKMDTCGATAWRVVLGIPGVVMLIGMIRGGQILFAGVILGFLLILGVGALTYRTIGPPPTP